VTVTTPLAATATARAHLTLSLELANRQPGTPLVSGMPVQLQQSTDGGADWSDVGAVQATNASGDVTLAATIASTTVYRISLPRFQATSWNAFSPNTQDLGVVGVAAPPAPRAIDRRAPRLSRIVLGRRLVTVRVSEAAKLRATVSKRVVRHVRRNGRMRTVVTFRPARVVRVRATRAGLVTLRWSRALPAGSYRIGLRATDAAHNVRIARVKRAIGERTTRTS
jgi:hypothetical protein